MARLEIEIGGSDKGGNSELKETIGLLEQLMQMRSGLNIELVKAENVQQLRAVGEQLTGVNQRIGEYLNLATKATQAWRDDRTEVILDNLSTRLAVVAANTQAFGTTVSTQTSELRAYQSAFDQLITNGLDRTSTEVSGLEANINRLTGSIQSQKSAIAEQKVYDTLSAKLAQVYNDTRTLGNEQKRSEASIGAYQSAINGLIKAGVDPADARIRSLKDSIAALNAQIGQSRVDALENGFERTGSIILDLNNKITNLRQKINFSTNEASIASLNKELADAQEELKRLNTIGLTADQQMRRFSSSSNAVGTEFARIVQDAPYATTALGAIQNNFGAIGNNITRLAELWPSYVAGVRAAAVANGQAASTAVVLRSAISGLFAGTNAYILVISLVVSAIQVWTAVSQKRAREAEKEKKKEEEFNQTLDNSIKKLSAVSRARAEAYSSAAKEITQVSALRRVIEDESQSRENRNKAVTYLQKEYPAYFGNLSREEILAGNAQSAYTRLTKSIRETSKARAALSLLTEIDQQNFKIELQRLDRQRKLNSELSKQEQISRRLSEIGTSASPASPGAIVTDANVKERDELNRQLSETNALIKQLRAEQAPAFKEQQKGIRDSTHLQEFYNNSIKSGGDILDSVTSKEKKSASERVKIAKELGESIRDIYTPDSDSGNLVGLDGLDRANQQVENKYSELFSKLDKTVADFTRYYDNQVKRKVLSEAQAQARITELTNQATSERQQIEEGKARELNANLVKFNEERSNKLTELEAKAGISRIRSREQELQANTAYWDKVSKEAVKYNITALELVELRKASEAQINAKWDAKISENEFTFRRRTNQEVTQLLIQELNKRTSAEVRAAEGSEQKILEIKKKYQEQFNAIAARERAVSAELAFDGSALSVPLAQVQEQVKLVKQEFDQGLNPSIEAFRTKIASLEVQRQQLQLFQTTIDGIAGAFGSFTNDILLDTENAIENLGKTFKKLSAGIISELVKIAVRYAINQAIGTASMAATAATSSATAATVASAWATAAALVSAATFGANTIPAGIGLASLVASSKALAGFSRGGYTGSMGRREVAGFVHGQEFVVNASATRDNLPLLRALNAGRDITPMMPSTGRNINYGSVDKAGREAVTVNVVGYIDNGVIKLANDQANRDFKRYF